jgi:hypothetical protein
MADKLGGFALAIHYKRSVQAAKGAASLAGQTVSSFAYLACSVLLTIDTSKVRSLSSNLTVKK